MAVVVNPNQQTEQEKQQQQSVAPGGQPLQTVGTASPSGQGPAGSPVAKAQATQLAQRQGSGRFTNLQKYLDANQSGGQKIAGQIQGKFDKQAQEIGQNISQGQAALQTRVNPLQQQLGEQGSQMLRQGFQDPNAILNDAQKLADYRNLQQGGQANIANIASTESLRQQAIANRLGELSDTAGLASTEQGRFQLLRNALSSPSYSQGAQRLDQVLLGSQGASSQLQAALKNATQQQQQGLTSLEQERMNRINALKTLSGERQGEWQGLLTGGFDQNSRPESDINQRGLGDIEASSLGRLQQAQFDANTAVPELRQALASGKITTQQAERLGLDPSMQTWGLKDLSKYITQTDRVADVYNTADRNEVDRYNALRKLAGMESGGMFGNANMTDIGSYNPYDFKKDQLTQDIAAAKKGVQVDQVNALINDMRNAGYFRGQSTGGGMRSADYSHVQRVRTGNILTDLQNQMKAGKISPDEYYDRVVKGVQQGWAGYGYDPMARSDSLYGYLKAHGNVIGNARNANLTTKELPTIPGQSTLDKNAIDWNAISNELKNSGYTLPTNKGPAPAPNPADMLPDKKKG